MFWRSGAGVFTALFLLMAATVCACSDKTFRDINYGSDLGSGFMPEVHEVQPDGVDGMDGGGSGGAGSGGVGSGGIGGVTGSGGADASTSPDESPDVVEAAGDDAETLDNS
jgi:hypothetical protein